MMIPRRFGVAAVLATAFATFALLAAGTVAVRADAVVEQKTRVEFPGFVGEVVNMLGGKSAREGVVTKTGVAGDRMGVWMERNAQIIALDEEVTYNLDLRRERYETMTFAEQRAQWEKMRQQLEEQQAERPSRSGGEGSAEPVEYEVEASVAETGRTDTLLGRPCREVEVKIIVRQKGKTLEEAGGAELTTLLMLAPDVEEYAELAEFQRRFAEKLGLDELLGDQQTGMMRLMAAYPQLGKMFEEMRAKKTQLEGFPLRTETRAVVVSVPGQASGEAGEADEGEEEVTSVGGMFRKLGKRFGRKRREKEEDKAADPDSAQATAQPDEGPVRKDVFSSTTEVLSLGGDAAALTTIPGGFKKRD